MFKFKTLKGHTTIKTREFTHQYSKHTITEEYSVYHGVADEEINEHIENGYEVISTQFQVINNQSFLVGVLLRK